MHEVGTPELNAFTSLLEKCVDLSVCSSHSVMIDYIKPPAMKTIEQFVERTSFDKHLVVLHNA